MNDVGTYSLTVTIAADGDHSSLLAMASVLHRRRVEVVDATITRPAQGHRFFRATILATARQANLVLRSMENVVNVLHAALFEAFEIPAGEKSQLTTGAARRHEPAVSRD